MAKSFLGTGVTIIDTSSDLPAASAALEGIMVFQKDTNELKICDGTNWISMLDTDVPPACELLYSSTFTGVSERTIDVFSSRYSSYRVILDNFTQNGAYSLGLKFRNTSASTLSDSSYFYTGQFMQYATGAVSSTYASSSTFIDMIGTNTGESFRVIDIGCSSSTSGYKEVTFSGIRHQSGVAVWGVWGQGGYYTSVGIGGISLSSPTGGTLSGKVQVYGFRN